MPVIGMSGEHRLAVFAVTTQRATLRPRHRAKELVCFFFAVLAMFLVFGRTILSHNKTHLQFACTCTLHNAALISYTVSLTLKSRCDSIDLFRLVFREHKYSSLAPVVLLGSNNVLNLGGCF